MCWEERGASVWPLPVFLSGKMQQCFFSMPGNTFQETTQERRREGKMLVWQQWSSGEEKHWATLRTTLSEQHKPPTLHTICIESSCFSVYLNPFSTRRFERRSSKWWSQKRGLCVELFIFKCASVIQSTNSWRWVKWGVKIWFAYVPSAQSGTEIKHRSTEVVLLSVNLVWSRQRGQAFYEPSAEKLWQQIQQSIIALLTSTR